MRTVTLTNGQQQHHLNVKELTAWGIVVDALKPELKPGTVIALSGPLGAGKTTLVQAVASALGVEKQPQSPTFALLRTYPLPKHMNGVSRLIHVDAYRIEDEKDLMPLDLDEELADGKSILLIEWAEKAQKWLASRPHIRVDIEV